MVLGDGFAKFRGRQGLAIGEMQRRKLELLTFPVCVSSYELLRRRRVCDAGPQTSLRPYPRNAMPEHILLTDVKLLFSPPCSPWDEALPDTYAQARVAIGWERA
jgi:hypothetical protein